MAKNGPELFKELLRIYPVAEVEDYWKNGAWKDELMRTDLQLIESHRKEAGAPEPPALEDVVMPPMPKATTFGLAAPGVKPFGAVAVPATGTPITAGTAIAELRLIALFVAKWKLEPTKAKAVLAKMLPHRRRYVIQNFKAEGEGDDATTALEQYIEECEKTNAWGNAPPAPVAVRPTGLLAPRPIAPRPVAFGTSLLNVGVKRPLSAILPVSAGFDPNKRLRPAISSPFGAIRPANYPLFRAGAAFGLAPQPVQSLASRLAGAVRGPIASVRPIFGQGRPVPALSFGAQPRMITPMTARPVMARPLGVRPMSAYPRPVAASPQPVRPMGQSFRPPQAAFGAPRPVFGGQIRPVPAGTQHGSLIRSLLQRY